VQKQEAKTSGKREKTELNLFEKSVRISSSSNDSDSVDVKVTEEAGREIRKRGRKNIVIANVLTSLDWIKQVATQLYSSAVVQASEQCLNSI